ncbi:MAG: MMPL family transporter [Desulfobulbaceae bacterium]|jgi:predicted RND superfamily exporter protein|nr:MMPL family transporter [Desulfobulbaceae bacterium]
MSSFFVHLTDFVLRNRAAVAVCIILVTGFFLWRMPGLRFDNSNEIWFSEGDPALARIKSFEKLFGNDDFIYLVFAAEKLFTPEAFRKLDTLASDIKKQVPFVERVTWLGKAESIEANDEGIIISDFMDLRDRLSMDELRQKALAEKNYRDAYISQDGRTAGMIVEMKTYPVGVVDPRAEATEKFRQVLAKPEYAALDVKAVGQPILHSDYQEISMRESATFFGVCVLIQMALLYKLGTGFGDALAPMLVVVLGVFWTLGLIQVLGYTLNLFIIIVPTLLICAGIGDSMHIIATRNQFISQGHGAAAAIRRAMAETGLPCLYTSLTTAAGFLGFCASDLRPFREMGVYTAVGAMMAYILSLLVVILFSSLKKDAPISPTIAPKAETVAPDRFDRFLLGVYRCNWRFPRLLLALFVILTVMACYGYSLVEVETGTAKMLSEKLSLRQAYDFVDARMGGSMSVEVMVDSGKENGVKELDFLRGLEKLQARLDASPLVTKTASVLDIIKKINQSMRGGDEAAQALPTGNAAVAQYLLLYETANGRELEKLVSFDSRVARLVVKTKTLGTGEARRLAEDVETFSSQVFAGGVTVSMAGSLDWTRSMNDLLEIGQRQSFFAALVIVSVLMCVSLRSLRLGFLSMLPNVFPVLITLGFMGFCGIHMDTPLMSFSAIIIGVVVDDTIHFLFHYRKAFDRSGSYQDALRETLLTVGRPMLFTTIIMLGGFAALLFSNVTGVMKFGGLACFAFLWALLADYFLVPAFLLTFRPLKRRAEVKA